MRKKECEENWLFDLKKVVKGEKFIDISNLWLIVNISNWLVIINICS